MLKKTIVILAVFGLLGTAATLAATAPISPITDAKWAQISVDSTGIGDSIWLTDKGYLQTDSTPRIIDGRLFVSFRWSAEVFGGSATWASREDGSVSLVTLYAPEENIAPPPPPIVVTNTIYQTITVTITQTVTVYVPQIVYPHPMPTLIVPPNTASSQDWIDSMAALINWNRANRGLLPLTLSPTLSAIALENTYRMALVYQSGVNDPVVIDKNHDDFLDRVCQGTWYGLNIISENVLAIGIMWDIEQRMVNTWLSSFPINNPQNAANIYDSNATIIGIGTWMDTDGVIVATALFAR